MSEPTLHPLKKSGFTLAEILMAMLVFSIAISTILALLARSLETVDEILLKDEAMRLSRAVENFMEEMPFTEAYNLVKSDDTEVYAYFYRGKPGTPRASDGTLQPAPDAVNFDDYKVVSGVREITDTPFITEDIEARESRIYRVRMTVSPVNPFGDSGLPDDPNQVVGGVPAYDSAVLVVFAEFFAVPVTGFSLSPDFNSVYEYNFAVRR